MGLNEVGKEEECKSTECTGGITCPTVDSGFPTYSCLPGNPIRPDFSGSDLVLWILERCVSISLNIQVMTPNFPGFSKS